jgi:hypothetical protein
VYAVRPSGRFACWERHHEVVAHAPQEAVSDPSQADSRPEGNQSCGIHGFGLASRFLAAYHRCEGLCGLAEIVHLARLAHRVHHAHPYVVRDRAAVRNDRKGRDGQESGRLAEWGVCLVVYRAMKWALGRSYELRHFVANALALKTWECQWQMHSRAGPGKVVWQVTSL